MMTRRSISMALLLPSIFAAVVIGPLVVSMVLQGPIILTGETKPLPSGDPPPLHLGQAILFFASMPWLMVFYLGWFALGLLVEPLVKPFWPGVPNPFEGSPLMDVFVVCAVITSPFINFFVLYWVGLRVDGAIERWRMRSPGTQP